MITNEKSQLSGANWLNEWVLNEDYSATHDSGVCVAVRGDGWGSLILLDTGCLDGTDWDLTIIANQAEALWGANIIKRQTKYVRYYDKDGYLKTALFDEKLLESVRIESLLNPFYLPVPEWHDV